METTLSMRLGDRIVSRLGHEIIVADAAGTIVYANDMAQDAIGDLAVTIHDLFADPQGDLFVRLSRAAATSQWQPINLTYGQGPLDGVEIKARARGMRDGDDTLLVIMGDRQRDDNFVQLRNLVRRLNSESRRSQDLNARLQAALESEGNLHRELIHRVKNNLALLTALVSLRRNASEEAGVKDALRDLEMRIHAIRAVHDILDQAGEINEVQAGELIRALCHQLDNSVMPEHVTVRNELLDVTLDVEQATPLALLVNELITNAAKHAFPGRERGTIEVSLQKNGHDKLEVRVADDGRGIAESGHIGSGSRIVEALAGQIGGELSRKSDTGGTTWTFVFPHRPPRRTGRSLEEVAARGD